MVKSSVKGIIWYYTDQQMARQRLQQLIEEYSRIHIEYKPGMRTLNWVKFENGDEWEIAATDGSSRGFICNISLIEQGTPDEIVKTIIMPCIKGKPYRTYNYY